jgi:hypothetical protein
MKYVKYSNVSKDDIVILTDDEFLEVMERWGESKPCIIERLGTVLPPCLKFPIGVPNRLRCLGGEDLFMATGCKFQPIALYNASEKRLAFMRGTNPDGSIGDDKTVTWSGETGCVGELDDLKKVWKLIPLDSAIRKNLITDFHVRCLFD